MKPIGRGKPIEVFVNSDFCHSSYWEVGKDKKEYGYLSKDKETGWLYLHRKCAADTDHELTYFGDDYEYCDGCGVTFSHEDMNMRDYEKTDEVHCPRCQSIEGSVLSSDDFPLSPTATIKAHVFQNYDALDALALKAGYSDHGNDPRYCGWIPMMGDSSHSVEGSIQSLNDDVEAAKETYDIIVGFCQTGNFSVGWTIYTKLRPENPNETASRLIKEQASNTTAGA